MRNIKYTMMSIEKVYQKLLMILFFSFIVPIDSSDDHKGANINKKMYQKTLAVLFCLTMIPIGTSNTCLAAESDNVVEIPKKLYAKKKELLDNDLFTLSKFDENDPDAKVGRISFGERTTDVVYYEYDEIYSKKRESKAFKGPITWLIAGTEDPSQQFIELYSEKPVMPKGDLAIYHVGNNSFTDELTGTPLEVDDGHWGTSQVRQWLNMIVAPPEEVYGEIDPNAKTFSFSDAERSLILKKFIRNYDAKNNINYYTQDRLYIPSFDIDKVNQKAFLSLDCVPDYMLGSDEEPLKVKIIPNHPALQGMSWLRTYDAGKGMYVQRDYDSTGSSMVGYKSPTASNEVAVNAAFKLNLNNVSFASAAPIQLGGKGSRKYPVYCYIEKNDPMQLRFCGNSNEIGTAEIDLVNKTVYVEGAESSRLMIQCVTKNGRNCCLRKDIDSNERQELSISDMLSEGRFYFNDIVTFNTMNDDVKDKIMDNISTCKVWLEKEKEDGLTYAVEATSCVSLQNIAFDDARIQSTDDHERIVYATYGDTVEQPLEALKVKFTPETFADKGVKWEVVSGDKCVDWNSTGQVYVTRKGDCTIRATSTADPTKYVECDIHVDPAVLTPVLKGSVSKLYDGTVDLKKEDENKSWINKLEIGLTGFLTDEDRTRIVAKASQYEFKDADKGTQKAVVASGISLFNNNLNRYILSTDTAEANVGTIEGISVEISKVGNYEVAYGSKRTLTADVGSKYKNAEFDKSVTWSSDNPDAITVDPETGEVTGIRFGETANITATSNYDSAAMDNHRMSVGKRRLEVTVKGEFSKEYDGTKEIKLNKESPEFSCTISEGSIINNDDVHLDTSEATYEFKYINVEDSAWYTHSVVKPIQVKNLKVTGKQGEKYAVDNSVMAGDGRYSKIVPATLKPKINGSYSKEYDGTKEIKLNEEVPELSIDLIGIVERDKEEKYVNVITDDVTYEYTDANVGVDKSIIAKGISLDGTRSENYKIVDAEGNKIETVTENIGTITARKLTPSIVKNISGQIIKEYDGTNVVTNSSGLSIALEGEIVGSDKVTAKANKYMFANANIGDHTITASDMVLEGLDSRNYQLSKEEVTSTSPIGTITEKVSNTDGSQSGTKPGTDKTNWGKEVNNNGIINYVAEDGTTSVELSSANADENGIVWLKEESDGSSAWYGIDYSQGVFKEGSRMHVRWLSKDTDKENWEKYYAQLDEKHKRDIEVDKLWIFLIGVTDPDGIEYKNLGTNVPLYIQLGEDWNKENINAMFIANGEDEPLDVSYVDNMKFPGGVSTFASLNLRHFSPYAVYDSKNEHKNQGASSIKTADTVSFLVISDFMVLVVLSGCLIFVFNKKRKHNI